MLTSLLLPSNSNEQRWYKWIEKVAQYLVSLKRPVSTVQVDLVYINIYLVQTECHGTNDGQYCEAKNILEFPNCTKLAQLELVVNLY